MISCWKPPPNPPYTTRRDRERDRDGSGRRPRPFGDEAFAALVQAVKSESYSDSQIAVIEQATGRRVIGFMSGNQQEPDMICEVFVLSPTDLVDDHDLMERSGG